MKSQKSVSTIDVKASHFIKCYRIAGFVSASVWQKPSLINPLFLVVCFFSLILVGCSGPSQKPFVAVNLVGYEVNTTKNAFLVNSSSDQFEIIRTSDSQMVYSNEPGAVLDADSATGDIITIIDFSSFNDPGEYIIKTPGSEGITSHPFLIARSVYSDALLTSIKSYYYHRCGTHVSGHGEWHYDICHVDDAPFYSIPEKSKEVTGGWHDAGDYNKFSVNTALSAGLLLYTYEVNPDFFNDNQLGIPESGNGIPDLLDEISWALEWLLKMQRDDGAVYHKVSQEKWIGEFLPHQDPSVRYIFDISTAATASFTASAALGARQLKELNPSLSMELKAAAIKAWNFLDEHPDNQPTGGFKNPDGVRGGEYGDPFDLDERIWASIELYKLTGDEDYISYFIQNYEKLNPGHIPPVSWRDAHSLAFYSFLTADIPDRFSEEKKFVRTALIRHADALVEVQKLNNYRNLLRQNEYYWGSNSVGLAYAMNLIQAYNLTDSLVYKDAALDQLHYVLGRNPFNLSQATGIGSASVKHPYHQLSGTGNFTYPVAGMLVGGPNNRLLLNNKDISPFPGKNYEDAFKNYLVNEPAINYTAILVYVLSVFSTSNNPTNAITSSK